jgi:hypothetical protein
MEFSYLKLCYYRVTAGEEKEILTYADTQVWTWPTKLTN